MKKRFLAVFLAVCVTAGTVAGPAESMTLMAAQSSGAQVTEQADGESISSGDMEIIDNELSRAQDPAVPDGIKAAEQNKSGNDVPEGAEDGIPAEERAGGNLKSEESGKLQRREVTEAQQEREQPPTGLLPVQRKRVSAGTIRKSDVVESDELFSVEKNDRASAVYSHEWDKYSNNYFYNQMSAVEKSLYDKLDEMCLKLLRTTAPAEYEPSEQAYYLGLIDVSRIGEERAANVMLIFRFSNPQYYFLNSAIWSGSSGDGRSYLSLGIYKAFGKGEARQTATGAVQAQLNAWNAQVAAGATEYEKVRIAHDLVMNKVVYDEAILNDPNFDDDKAFSQSAYSVFCTDKTVCAGYSQAIEMLCNAAGIDAVAVTSKAHEWNKIRIDDSWYNVDGTWDDGDDGVSIYYDFFARSDGYYDTVSAYSAENHMEEDFWIGKLPPCTLDSGAPAMATEPGTIPVITDTAAAPVITEKIKDDEIMVTLSSATPGAVMYYSVDGKTAPSPSAVRCQRYTKPFAVDSKANVQAVAVCDTKLDSAVSARKMPQAVTLEFDGNGEDSGSMSDVAFLAGSGQKLPANKFKRKYYTFTGWNTKKNGKGTTYKNRQAVASFPSGTKKTLTLYAQWEKTKYKITYNLNGGKNNSKNPATYTHTTKTITFKAPTRAGYRFGGWYTNKKCTAKITQIKKGSSGNKTLYAKWIPNKYKVRFDGNGSTGGTMKALDARTYGKSFSLPANQYRRTGYTFAGWSTKKNGGGKTYKNKESVKNLTTKNNGTVTLYAQWKKKK